MTDEARSENFTDLDLRAFHRYRIGPELLALNCERVTDEEARQKYGMNGIGNNAGIIFLYRNWKTGCRVTCRLRRDHPDVQAGKPVRKYLAPFGDRRSLFIPAGCRELVEDRSVPAVLVEAEKSALMLRGWSTYREIRLLPIALGGCNGWRGRIGRTQDSCGHRVDERGPLPDLRICAGREVIIALDSNAATNANVRKARRDLTAELITMGARVRIGSVPDCDGRVNGPDDLYAISGPEAIAALLNGAVLAAQVAESEADEALTRLDADKENIVLVEDACDAIAAVHDRLRRSALQGRLKRITRGLISGDVVTSEIGARSQEQEQRATATQQEIEELALRSVDLDLQQMIDDLETFFVDRAHIPEGGALVLAYFALNTYSFQLFDTTPYICLESATPRCGKSTVERLLAAICSKARSATAMNEPIFRIIDKESPTLIIDEAESLEGRTDRAEALRTILNEGYKKGAEVPRCVGEDNDIKFFKVFCPKVFSLIGGISGALLDRCIVLHMERLPPGRRLRSSRVRVLRRDADGLIQNMKAYSVQNRERLQALYDDEPDEGYWHQLADREAELWGPLVLHARVIGECAEQKLLATVARFIESKADIEAQDLNIAKAIALFQVLEALTADKYNPGDLVAGLEETEAWAPEFSKITGDEKARHKGTAARVGYFLRSFRLKGERRRTGITYNRQETLDKLLAHIPANLSHLSQLSQGNHSHMQPVENTGDVNGVNGVNGLQGTVRDTDQTGTKHAPEDPGDGDDPQGTFIL